MRDHTTSDVGSGPFGRALRGEREYWADKLAGPIRGTTIPADYARQDASGRRGMVAVTLDAATADRLRAASGGRHTLMLVFLVAAFKALLHRLTGAGDVVIATTIHESAAGVGQLNQILVLRDTVNGSDAWRTLLASVQRTLKEAYANQKFPFQRLGEVVAALDARAGVEDLCRIVILLDAINDRRKAHAAKSDLVVAASVAAASSDGAQDRIEFDYDADLFAPQTIERVAQYYVRSIAETLERPDARIGDLVRIADDRAAQARGARAAAAWYPADRTIHDLFDEQAAHTPSAVAAVCGADAITYESLRLRSARLAARLVARGAGRGTRVAIYLDHSIDLVVAIVGVLKAGAAYVPLDPGASDARLVRLLTAAEPVLVLAQTDLAPRLPPEWHDRWLGVEDDGGSPAAAAHRAGPTDLAYVIFTSGSTGDPKGVRISHRALVNYVWWAREVYAAGEPLAFALLTSIAFDLTVTSIFTPLITGGHIVVYPKKEGWQLADVLRDNRVDVVKVTPSHLAQCRDVDATGSRVTRFIVGGEALETALARTIDARFGGRAAIFNEYGPTEATVGCVMHRFDPARDNRVFVPIGTPAANVEIHLLDEARQPVPPGALGQIYIAGDGLADGYLNDADLTAARFVDRPGAPGETMYATGDDARWLLDGGLEYVGRRDDQVKYHGHRVELNALKAILNGYPGIRDSVVVLRKDDRGHDVLMACYVARRGVPIAALREFMRAQTAEETIPNLFVRLSKLPLTVNGKIDYGALPTIAEAREHIEGSTVGPRTPIEETLCRVWRDVLRIDDVGVHTSFFELGGDSILSLELVAKAARSGLRLSVADVFAHQTIARLADVSTPLAGRGAPDVVEGDVPLTPIQHWFFERDLADPHHYNQAVCLNLRQRIGCDVLERASRHLVDHHDALRLRFVRDGASWRQTFGAASDARVSTEIDVSGLSPSTQPLAIACAAGRLQRSLDLGAGPLARVALFDLGPAAPQRVLMIVHHLVVDGVSWRILLRDLQAACEQARQGTAIDLGPKGTSFQAWALALQEHAQSPATRAELARWAALRDVNGGRLSRTFRDGLNDAASARIVTRSLSRDETSNLLRAAASVHQADLHELLLAALAGVVSSLAGGANVLVDTEAHGREPIDPGMDLSSTVGWFTTIVPVVLAPTPGSPADRVRGIKEQTRSLPRRGLGHGLLRYLCSDGETKRALATLPRAEMSVNYLGQFDHLFGEGSFFDRCRQPVGSTRSGRGERAYLIEIDARILDGELQVAWTYGDRIHRRDTIETAADEAMAGLRQLASASGARVKQTRPASDFPLAAIEPSALDRLLDAHPHIVDVYPLSPMQEGLLFHALYEPESGAYLTQFVCRFEGTFDAEAFRTAWQRSAERHPILRTGLASQGLDRPVQFVESRVDVPWQYVDWIGMTADEQETHWYALLHTDRARGFDVARPPLLRLTIVRVADRTHRLLCTSHHLVLDGWSSRLLLNEVVRQYDAICRAEALALPQACPYRDYIAWLQRQDLAAAERFWKETLKGFTRATRLRRDAAIDGGPVPDHARRARRQLSPAATRALVGLARAQRVTLNTICQAAWSILLCRRSGERDVLFGVTTSGRPDDLPGVESMIGPIFTTLPFRVQIGGAERLDTWLEHVQNRQAALLRFQHCSLVQIHEWSDMPRGTALFESVLVFENYPVNRSLKRQARTLGVRDFRVRSEGHGVSAVVLPGDELELEIWDDRADGAEAAAPLLRLFGNILEIIAERSDLDVDGVLEALDRRDADAFRAFRRERRASHANVAN